jgi:hypothetical protein
MEGEDRARPKSIPIFIRERFLSVFQSDGVYVAETRDGVTSKVIPKRSLW